MLEVCRDKTDKPSAAVDDVKLQKSPHRVGLREKLLRLAPSSTQKNTSCVHEEEQAGSQPSVPTVNVETATESENEGEDEQGGEEIQIHSKGDNRPNPETETGADSRRDVEEEVLLPDIAGRSCTPVRDSQNSKY